MSRLSSQLETNEVVRWKCNIVVVQNVNSERIMYNINLAKDASKEKIGLNLLKLRI